MLCNLLPLPAQQASPPSAPPLDGTVRSQVIESVLTKLNAEYVFPDVAKKMEAAIHERMQKQEYDTFSEGVAFADKLKYARAWSDYYGRPVHVGEFGANIQVRAGNLDVLEFYRRMGRGYQTKINAVLRSYMEHAKG